MAKVVRLIINDQYLPLKTDKFVKGEVVPFDVYIKRYNDFVIIIEAGTLLNEALYNKLLQQERIYIVNHDVKKLKSYFSHSAVISLDEENTNNLDPLSAALAIKEKSSAISEIEKRLFFVYSTVSELMESIFESGNEELPLDALSGCVNEIVNVLSDKAHVLPIILKILPDTYSTYHHSSNVTYFATILGIMLKMNNEELIDLSFSALLHDIGKLRIDESILEKSSSLNDDEFESIKHHPLMGCEILEQNGIENQTILKGVRHHHERLDGSGYPDGLRGKLIPQNARIIGVCDVFDALTTNRTFRENYTSFEALLLMKREMHMQLDEKLVDMFIQLHR